MESSSWWAEADRDDPCPSLALKIKLVYVVKSFLILVDASKYVHRGLSSTRRMPVPSLNRSFNSIKLEPYVFL